MKSLGAALWIGICLIIFGTGVFEDTRTSVGIMVTGALIVILALWAGRDRGHAAPLKRDKPQPAEAEYDDYEIEEHEPDAVYGWVGDPGQFKRIV